MRQLAQQKSSRFIFSNPLKHAQSSISLQLKNCCLLVVDSNEQSELWPKCLLNHDIKLRKYIF